MGVESGSGAPASCAPGQDPGPFSAAEGEQRALALIQAGQRHQAAQLYRQLIAAGQAGPVAYANLAVLLEGTAPTQELVGLWRQALALQPNVAEAHGNLGLLLLLLHEPDLRVPDQRRSAWVERLQASLQTSEAAISASTGRAPPTPKSTSCGAAPCPWTSSRPWPKPRASNLYGCKRALAQNNLGRLLLPIAVSLVSP